MYEHPVDIVSAIRKEAQSKALLRREHKNTEREERKNVLEKKMAAHSDKMVELFIILEDMLEFEYYHLSDGAKEKYLKAAARLKNL